MSDEWQALTHHSSLITHHFFSLDPPPRARLSSAQVFRVKSKALCGLPAVAPGRLGAPLKRSVRLLFRVRFFRAYGGNFRPTYLRSRQAVPPGGAEDPLAPLRAAR